MSKKKYNRKEHKRKPKKIPMQIIHMGIYRSTSKNFGFVELIDNEDKDMPDVFVSDDNNVPGAIANDEVLVEIVPSHDVRSKTGKEGIILEIVKRSATWFTGVLKIRSGEYFVQTDKRSGNLEIFVNRKNLNGAILDNLVKIKLSPESLLVPSEKSKKKAAKPKKKLYGEVECVLGEKDSALANYESILLSHNIKTKFDEELIELAEAIASNSGKAEINDREDLRDKMIFTIDSDSAKDLDDAISIDIDEENNYVLGVHIADVSHYVSYKSPLDLEAYERGTSVYFIDKVVPMLPQSLSNGICSLNEGEDRLCLSAFMTIDKRGNIIKSRFANTIINSKIKGIYSEINELFADIYKKAEEVEAAAENIADLKKKYKKVMPTLRRARKLAEILKKRRIKNGTLELESTESDFVMTYDEKTGEPKILDIKKVLTGESEGLIEEFMIRANEAVAEFLSGKDLPCIYRVHEKPFYNKIEAFAGTLKRVGYSSDSLKNLVEKNNEIHPKELQKILNYFKGTPLFQMINTHMLRSLAKARYSAENFGHFGLASEQYCHFTSPIRRYPDLVNHRILKMALANDDKNLNSGELKHFVDFAAKQSTEKEMSAVGAEREIDNLYRTIYMSERLGEIYMGTISSVTNFGVFVMLNNTCEGLIHVSNMDDYYEFDASSFELYSDFKRYSLGQKVKIKVVGVSISEGTVDFIFWE